MCRGRPVEVLPARPAESQDNMAGLAGLTPAVRACMLPADRQKRPLAAAGAHFVPALLSCRVLSAVTGFAGCLAC